MERVQTVGIAMVKVAREPEKLRTVLGSCIGIALYDPRRKIGGLGHVMLPESSGGVGDRGKFADTGVDLLLEEMLAAGAEKVQLRAKIAGGASMFGTETANGIGERNATAVRKRLEHHQIRLLAEDVGGGKGKKMLLDLATGSVTVEAIGEEPKVI